VIAARGLTKRYGTRLALDGVDFTAADGRITGLLGPNGAGKTTTFRIAAGLLAADDGAVEIGPGDGWRALGVLPHGHGLYSRLTAREQVEYFGALRGLRGARLRARVSDLLAQLGLADRADSPTGTLSEGQRMKVALACALVHEPANLILDEPTSGLDVMSTRALHDVLRTLRGAGACILFSSHVMHEVAALCDRVVMLAHGRVVAAGPPGDLLRVHRVESLEDLFVSLSHDAPAVGTS
jgi:sodium transport system ATP-binding protein